MKVILGIDCGATHLRIGIIDQKGRLLEYLKVHSPLKFHPEQFGAEIHNYSKILLNKAGLMVGDIQGIGVGIPGPLDVDQGLLFPSSNVGNTKVINIRKQIDHYFNAKIYFDRDTLVALRGESWQGAAKGSTEVVLLTLGTGVGGAMLLNGKIYEGLSSKAGEIGHIYIEGHLIGNSKEIPICGLGHPGCFEAYVHAAKNLDDLGGYLGIELANIVAIFNPQKIIIGGGMVKKGNFLPQAIKVMKEKGMSPQINEVKVQYAALGDLSGIYGAAKLVSDSIR